MINILNFIKRNSSKESVNLLRDIRDFLKTIFRSNDLNFLAQVYQTDKYGSHFYTPHYVQHFRHLKNEKIKLLEIGIGGYKYESKGGASLKMWRRYFGKAKIFGIDIHDKSFLNSNRIKTYKGSQSDIDFLGGLINEVNSFDIIIDDGSHINSDVITTFNYLFPYLKNEGIYVVEDTQTSYWKHYGGDDNDLNNMETIMGYFKSLVDGLNHMEIKNESFDKSYYSENISSIHFYHNMIFIKKGMNNEKSNIIKKK